MCFGSEQEKLHNPRQQDCQYQSKVTGKHHLVYGQVELSYLQRAHNFQVRIGKQPCKNSQPKYTDNRIAVLSSYPSKSILLFDFNFNKNLFSDNKGATCHG